jgi:hypothetical protein
MLCIQLDCNPANKWRKILVHKKILDYKLIPFVEPWCFIYQEILFWRKNHLIWIERWETINMHCRYAILQEVRSTWNLPKIIYWNPIVICTTNHYTKRYDTCKSKEPIQKVSKQKIHKYLHETHLYALVDSKQKQKKIMLSLVKKDNL